MLSAHVISRPLNATLPSSKHTTTISRTNSRLRRACTSSSASTSSASYPKTKSQTSTRPWNSLSPIISSLHLTSNIPSTLSSVSWRALTTRSGAPVKTFRPQSTGFLSISSWKLSETKLLAAVKRHTSFSQWPMPSRFTTLKPRTKFWRLQKRFVPFLFLVHF